MMDLYRMWERKNRCKCTFFFFGSFGLSRAWERQFGLKVFERNKSSLVMGYKSQKTESNRISWPISNSRRGYQRCMYNFSIYICICDVCAFVSTVWIAVTGHSQRLVYLFVWSGVFMRINIKMEKKLLLKNFIVGHEQMSNTLQKNIYNKYGNGCVCQFKSKSYERKSTWPITKSAFDTWRQMILSDGKNVVENEKMRKILTNKTKNSIESYGLWRKKNALAMSETFQKRVKTNSVVHY